jgi:hypothetical protein
MPEATDRELLSEAIDALNGARAAQGERVAIVETKIGGLEKDTAVIRATLHQMNGELQRSALHEADCARSLALIADQTKGLPELVGKIANLEATKPKIEALLEEASRRKGAWRGLVLMGTAIGGLMAIAAALATVLAFLLAHH